MRIAGLWMHASVATILAIVCSSCSGNSLPNVSQLVLSVTPVEPSHQQLRLRIELEFHGAKRVVVDRSMLPWGIRDALLIVPIVTDPFGTRVDEAQYVDDPHHDYMDLTPDDSLSGEVDLQQRFPDLAEALTRRDVVVFWSYELRPVDGPAYPRISGAVLIPSRKQGLVE